MIKVWICAEYRFWNSLTIPSAKTWPIRAFRPCLESLDVDIFALKSRTSLCSWRAKLLHRYCNGCGTSSPSWLRDWSLITSSNFWMICKSWCKRSMLLGAFLIFRCNSKRALEASPTAARSVTRLALRPTNVTVAVRGSIWVRAPKSLEPEKLRWRKWISKLKSRDSKDSRNQRENVKAR